MRYSVLIMILLITAGSVSAQKNKMEPEVVDPGASSTGKGGTASAVPADEMARLSAKLLGTLDAKSTKPGDKVELKVLSSLVSEGQVIVPKGAKLLGRVTEVKKKDKRSEISQIEMVIDRLANRDLILPVTAQIVSITSVAGRANPSLSSGDDLFPQSNATATRPVRGGGGGLLGGVTQTVGSTVGGVAGASGSVLGSTTAGLGQTINGAGSSISGLQISNAANGSLNSASSFSANGKNVRIEKGTTFDVVVLGSPQ